jgi:hypothetical protein
MLVPDDLRIGSWHPSLILFHTSRSATSLTEHLDTGKSLLLTYLKQSARKNRSAKRLFCRNAERLQQLKKNIRIVTVNERTLIIQPFRDETSLNRLFQICRKSGKKIPGRVLSRIFYSLASRGIHLLRKGVRFEFHAESLTVDRYGRTGIYFALPDRGYKLHRYQIPNLLVQFCSPFQDLIEPKGDHLQTFFNYPNLENLKNLRTEAVRRIDLERWLKQKAEDQDEEDSDLEFQQVQRLSASRDESSARLVEREWSAPATVQPVSIPQKKQNWQIYVLLGTLTLFLGIVGGWNRGIKSAKPGGAVPRNSAPVLIAAPPALYSPVGKTVATVLIHVGETGSVMSHQFQRGTAEQIARYNPFIQRMKYQASYSNRKPKSAWLIVELPLRN